MNIMEKTSCSNKCSFQKSERLCSKRIIDQLFAGGNRSFAAYPIRAVFSPVDEGIEEPVAILVSVSAALTSNADIETTVPKIAILLKIDNIRFFIFCSFLFKLLCSCFH